MFKESKSRQSDPLEFIERTFIQKLPSKHIQNQYLRLRRFIAFIHMKSRKCINSKNSPSFIRPPTSHDVSIAQGKRKLFAYF